VKISVKVNPAQSKTLNIYFADEIATKVMVIENRVVTFNHPNPVELLGSKFPGMTSGQKRSLGYLLREIRQGLTEHSSEGVRSPKAEEL
jgi:hypothetical protein